MVWEREGQQRPRRTSQEDMQAKGSSLAVTVLGPGIIRSNCDSGSATVSCSMWAALFSGALFLHPKMLLSLRVAEIPQVEFKSFHVFQSWGPNRNKEHSIPGQQDVLFPSPVFWRLPRESLHLSLCSGAWNSRTTFLL